MKKAVQIDLANFPQELSDFLHGAQLYNSNSHSGATVYYVSTGYYLKIDQAGHLAQEARMAQYFYERDLGVEVIAYISAEQDYLLTKAAIGQTALSLLDQPKHLCHILAEVMQQLHQLDVADLVLPNRTQPYLNLVIQNYQQGAFYDKVLLPRFGIANREAAYQLVQNQSHLLQDDTFIHGDFCLPNIIIANRCFSKLIDVGLAGRSDKHIDLFWAIWSLHYNLKTDCHTNEFLAAYGKDQIDHEKLRLIAACEAFG